MRIPRKTLVCAGASVIVALVPLYAQAQGSTQEETPFRLTNAIGVPGWLSFGLEHRIRFEHLENDFRSAAKGDATALSLRTLLSAELKFNPLFVGAELCDARVYATRDTLLNNNIADALDLLQAYGGLRVKNLLVPKDAAELRAGRFSLDVGSRRLSARNDFRNTINGFTGIKLQWTSPAQHSLQAFAAFPVLRQPSKADELKHNPIDFNEDNTQSIFWGVFFGSGPLFSGVHLESYVFGLHEEDQPEAPSINRRLVTPGFRILRTPKAGALDFQMETMLQLGLSRASPAPDDQVDLTHRAGSIHFSAGYRLDWPWKPRAALHYDYASGDESPADKINQRFDPLFGARRFDFGPTGLYGAVARSNINSPGLKLEAAPHKQVDAFIDYRAIWLASATDAWTTAGLRDSTGESGSFVGHQLEGRMRWHIFPKNLILDMGAAGMARGNFSIHAPKAKAGSPLFVYSQITGTL